MKTIKGIRENFSQVVLIVLIFFVSISCVNAKTKSQKVDDIPTKIAEVMDKAVEMKLFSGCILVAKGNKVLFSGAYGEANKDFHIKNTLGTDLAPEI